MKKALTSLTVVLSILFFVVVGIAVADSPVTILAPYGYWITCTMPAAFACPPADVVAKSPKMYMLSIKAEPGDTTTTAYGWVVTGLVDGKPVVCNGFDDRCSGVVTRHDNQDGFTTVLDIDAGGFIVGQDVTVHDLSTTRVRRGLFR